MKKWGCFFIILMIFSCQHDKNEPVLANLPNILKEVSGNEFLKNSSLIWMINDSGNSSDVYGVNRQGEIKKTLKINAKNHDWEDLASDEKGNLYIGDFGNNSNTRKNLRILKVASSDLSKYKAKVEIIEFKFENQHDFPPKKSQLSFDAEAFFYFQKHFYIFTKSRIPDKFGETLLYKIPAKKGKHKAIYIGKFFNGKENASWITGADISDDGKTVVLLFQKNVLLFSDFTGDDFFSGTLKIIPFIKQTQKEGICFTNNKTLLLTDEKYKFKGGKLYEFSIN